jgi:type II secretory pathway predicted ATPase ExeA
MTYPRQLSDTDRVAIRQWVAPILKLPVHRELEHQMRLGMEGVESTLVLGDLGTSKTESCRRLAEEIEHQELQESFKDSAYVPRRILMYESSTADGRKTALVDLCERLAQEELSASARRVHTPTNLVARIAEACRRRAVHLIMIDEAQMISSHNLDQLRQVPDAASRLNHQMGIIYIGTPELRALMVKTQQLGQRVSAEVHFERLTGAQLLALMEGWHPHFKPLAAHLGTKQWKVLVERVEAKSRGSIRRIDRIVRNAHHFALALNRCIDEELLTMAIDKLSDEA